MKSKKNLQREIKVVRLIKNSYLAVIRNSVGSKMFRDFYAEVNGKKQNITRKGDLSCAFYVSSILVIFGLVKKMHGTIQNTIKDMKEEGWEKIKKPKEGCIIVWKAKKFGQNEHEHIGFYIGRGKAISTSSKKGLVAKHNWQFDKERKIKSLFWHKSLNK